MKWRLMCFHFNPLRAIIAIICEELSAAADYPFHLEPDRPGFESMGQENGFRF